MKSFPVWRLNLKHSWIMLHGFSYRITEYPNGHIVIYEAPSVFFPVRGHLVIEFSPESMVDTESAIDALHDYARNRFEFLSRYKELKFWRALIGRPNTRLEADAASLCDGDDQGESRGAAQPR